MEYNNQTNLEKSFLLNQITNYLINNKKINYQHISNVLNYCYPMDNKFIYHTNKYFIDEQLDEDDLGDEIVFMNEDLGDKIVFMNDEDDLGDEIVFMNNEDDLGDEIVFMNKDLGDEIVFMNDEDDLGDEIVFMNNRY